MSKGKLKASCHQPKGRWITKHKRLAIYMRDEFMCCYCGRDLTSASSQELNLDHIVCRADGGTNHETNLITACKSCNSSRGSKSVENYATGGALKRIKIFRYRVLNIQTAKDIIAGKTGKFDN